ncbi:Glu-AdT subunit A [Halocaridina rubra]|uniref:Glutamyl-tRNA(Gln) amidotransferase subunit A, mitochondrial n=1 Tax=Halocaridina rubra TaxID=373956 RepID=A0AAN8ZW13_HALRR
MKCLSGSIKNAVQLFKQKQISPLEVCEAALRRQETISRLNAYIPNAVVETTKSEALLSSQRYEKGTPLSPLDGIPIALKDNFCTAGIRTTCGSNMLKNYVPIFSATVAERLQKAGTILMGKTNLDEFAMGSGTVDSIFGPVKNIHRSGLCYKFIDTSGEAIHTSAMKPTGGLEKDDFYITGGSSGGSAVAVAAASAFLATGSDTGGSVRNPASFCGVVGLKPSYGVVPRHGLISLVNSMDVPGLFARTVDDVAAMLAVISGLDPKDSTSVPSNMKTFELPESPSIEGLVVGIPKEYHRPGMSSEIIDVWTMIADLLENKGAKVREVSLPHTKYSIVCYSILNPCEVASNFTRYTGVEYGQRMNSSQSMEAMYALTRSQGLNNVVRSRILAGNYFLLEENKEKYFKQALKVRRLICQDFNKVWSEKVNLLLTPVTLSASLRYSEFIKYDNRSQTATQDICTQSANMAGLPAVSIPISLNDEGLPLALQLMAPMGKDVEMLSAAKWIEQQVGYPKLRVIDT